MHNAEDIEGGMNLEESTVRQFLAALGVVAAAVSSGAPAFADPAADPHMPICRRIVLAVVWVRRSLSLTATGCRIRTARTGTRFSTERR